MPPETKFQLRILTGPSAGHVFSLARRNYRMGRTHQVDDPGDWILLEESTVSRHHAELMWAADRETFELVHCSKTNPTLVNQIAVERVMLASNDQLRLGMLGLRFEATNPFATALMNAENLQSLYLLEDRAGLPVAHLNQEEVNWSPKPDAPPLVLKQDSHGFRVFRPDDFPNDVYVVRTMDGATWSTSLRPGESVQLRHNDKLRSSGQRVVFVRKQSTTPIL